MRQPPNVPYFGQRGEDTWQPVIKSDAALNHFYPPCPKCGARVLLGNLSKAPVCWDELVRPQTHTE